MIGKAPNLALSKANRSEKATFLALEKFAKKSGMFLKTRIITGGSNSKNRSETDAVLFTDKGLIFVEVKRWAGEIVSWTHDLISIDIRSSIENRPNPFKKMGGVIAEMIRNDLKNSNSTEWADFRNIWQSVNRGHIPIVRLVVFGPTTRGDLKKLNLGEGEFVATTRTLATKLKEITNEYLGAPILGSARVSYQAASQWRHQGRLSFKKGSEVNCYLEHAYYPKLKDGRYLVPSQVAEIKGGRKGNVKLRFHDSKRFEKFECDELKFWIFENSKPELKSIPLTEISSFKVGI